MNLWIRSQDKMKLVNNCNLYISDAIKDEYVIEDLNNKYLKLGTYKTKSRALEVLDEIQQLLVEYVNFNGYEIVNKFTSRVYEMPEE